MTNSELIEGMLRLVNRLEVLEREAEKPKDIHEKYNDALERRDRQMMEETIKRYPPEKEGWFEDMSRLRDRIEDLERARAEKPILGPRASRFRPRECKHTFVTCDGLASWLYSSLDDKFCRDCGKEL